MRDVVLDDFAEIERVVEHDVTWLGAGVDLLQRPSEVVQARVRAVELLIGERADGQADDEAARDRCCPGAGVGERRDTARTDEQQQRDDAGDITQLEQVRPLHADREQREQGEHGDDEQATHLGCLPPTEDEQRREHAERPERREARHGRVHVVPADRPQDVGQDRVHRQAF